MTIVPIITSGQLSRGDSSVSHCFSQRMPFGSFLAAVLKKALLHTGLKRCVWISRWEVFSTSWATNTSISPHPQLFFLSRLWRIVLSISVGPVQTQRGWPPPLMLRVSCFLPCGSSEALQSTQRSHQHSGNFEEIGLPRPVFTSEKGQLPT